MMQLPSLNSIIQKTGRTFKRFPLALLSAIIVAVISIYLVEASENEAEWLFCIILVALLGIPLFTVIPLIIQKNKWSQLTGIAIYAVGVLLLILYYFWLPDDFDYTPYSHVYRYMLYVLGMHLLVAIGPFWNRGETSAFWQYNKTLFLRFLTAVFFSGVLFAGLSIALVSVDVLLGITIDEKSYLQLFFFIGAVFNTWFFLAGIPSAEAFDRLRDYPKGLKIFTQNILIPLVVIYLAILYLYAGKIILQWSWPEGWVANLILSFSIAGILALLLLHPIRDKAENRWISRFSTGYFWALIPLVILLMLAIYRRIWEYGITVERYFVLILGLWLAGIVLYFLFSRKQNIKVIPASLCVLAFLVSFGPWGAFSVSERSQINRLEFYLNKNNLLQDSVIRQASSTVPFQDRREISNIVRYLNNTHSLDGIQPWFEQDFDSLTVKAGKADSTQPVSHYNRPEHVVELMGIAYVWRGADQPARPAFNQFHTDRKNVLEVRDVSVIIQNLNWLTEDTLQERGINGDRTFIMQSGSAGIKMYLKGSAQDSISVNLKQLIQQLSRKFPKDQHRLPAEEMTFDFSTGQFGIRIYFNQISWHTEEKQIILENARFDVGIK